MTTRIDNGKATENPSDPHTSTENRRVRPAFAAAGLLLLYLPLLIGIGSAYAPLLRRLCESRLDGMDVTVATPILSAPAWMSGRFQAQTSAYLNQVLPLREAFVRLDNQLDYSLFNTSHMADSTIVVGKCGQLFEYYYLAERLGLDPPVPQNRLTQIADEILDLQTGLAKRHVALVVLLTPSKASLYPQYIPAGFPSAKPGLARSYDTFLPLLMQRRVNVVDGRGIFSRAKLTQPYPLFAKNGSHWNTFGAALVTQALVDKIANVCPDRRWPRISIDGVRVDDQPSKSDLELASLMNLIRPPSHALTPHPQLRWTGATNPPARLVLVGGSFSEIPLYLMNEGHVFGEMDYYRYYHRSLTSYPAIVTNPVDVSKIDWNNDIFSHNVVVIEINEAMFGDGRNTHYTAFVEDALRHLGPD